MGFFDWLFKPKKDDLERKTIQELQAILFKEDEYKNTLFKDMPSMEEMVISGDAQPVSFSSIQRLIKEWDARLGLHVNDTLMPHWKPEETLMWGHPGYTNMRLKGQIYKDMVKNLSDTDPRNNEHINKKSSKAERLFANINRGNYSEACQGLVIMKSNEMKVIVWPLESDNFQFMNTETLEFNEMTDEDILNMDLLIL